MQLLGGNDPEPVIVSGDILAAGPFFLIGDHAGAAIPHALRGLGLGAHDRARHIAIDIGVEDLGIALSGRLAAPFIRQTYSRLAIDCNRDPDRDDAIPENSDGTAVPGNIGLASSDRKKRVADIFRPYHAAISAALDARQQRGLRTILLSLHSFTPVLDGQRRPWQIGVLHNGGDQGFALDVLRELRRSGEFVIGDNQPYEMDSTDFTVPFHAFARGLAYLELEVRQDLIDPEGGGDAERTANFLANALRTCGYD